MTGFHGISAAEGFHVRVTDHESFEVIAPKKTQQLDVRRGNWRAYMGNSWCSSDQTKGGGVTIRVTMSSLAEAEAERGARIVADLMSGAALDVSVAIGSALDVDLIKAALISVQASSGPDLKIAGGTCDSFSVTFLADQLWI